MLARWKNRVEEWKHKTYVLYFALRDPRTPFLSRALLFFVVVHTLSPIDLVPDFVPVLGYLDDLLITPLGLYIAYRIIPKEVIEGAEQSVMRNPEELERLGRVGTILVVTSWIMILVFIGLWLFSTMN